MTVLSIDRQISGPTKLERLGERAASQKETVFNNLGHLIDKTLLLELYHRMEGKRAVGIDGVNKQDYGKELNTNIDQLLIRLRRGTYHPQPARVTEIPKEDGSKRPLAVSCFEDKLSQAAVSAILTSLYEPLFLSCSYGFRPGRSCHDALRALLKHTYPCWDGAIVEIDIRQCFNSIPHQELRKILQKKITDERFLRLVDKLATAPILHEGKIVPNAAGCPQGSILSPILANIFLHEVIDGWFDTIKRNHFTGIAEEVRYADDMVFVFQHYAEAKRFFNVLPKRLKKYGLTLHADKSRLIRSGQNAAERAYKAEKRIPTYQFLGFTVYWAKARNGQWWRMKFKTRRDRFTAKLKGLKQFLKKQLNTNTRGTLTLVASVMRGWLNYHAISDNERMVQQFIRLSRRTIRDWLNRRGRKRPMSWEKFNDVMKQLNIPETWKTTSLF